MVALGASVCQHGKNNKRFGELVELFASILSGCKQICPLLCRSANTGRLDATAFDITLARISIHPTLLHALSWPIQKRDTAGVMAISLAQEQIR